MRFFDFGDEGGADDGGVGEAAEKGDVSGQRNSEAHRDRKICDSTRAAQERWKIIGERILCTGNAGPGNEIEKAGGAGSNFCEAFVRGSRRTEEDGVKMLRGENTAIVDGFFGSEIGGEDAVSADGCGGGSKFFEAHLEDGIVVAEEGERDFVRGRARLANAANEIEDAGQRRAGFQSALRGALNSGTVSEGIAEGHAEFAGGTQVGEAFGDAGRTGGFAGHEFLRKTRA